MARPSMSVKVTSKNLTKEEYRVRQETEDKLRGLADKLKPPKNLTTNQKKIFKFIVNELKASEILGNLDIFIITSCATALDRIQVIETMINDDPEKLLDRALMSSKDKYTRDFHRAITELSLSPAARAKLGNINLNRQQEQEDPLLKALTEDDEDE